MNAASKSSSELSTLLRPVVPYLGTAGAFSLAINLLYLAGPLYMLQVYDRVVPSSSETTLVMLTLALLMAYIALAGLDAMRARVLTRASVKLDRKIAAAVVTASIDQRQEPGATKAGGRSRPRTTMEAFPAAAWSGPALQQLLADIAERRINVVVVYKVDRLTTPFQNCLARYAELA